MPHKGENKKPFAKKISEGFKASTGAASLKKLKKLLGLKN